jgi:hypothetical protein
VGSHSHSVGFFVEHVEGKRGGEGAAVGIHEAADAGNLQRAHFFVRRDDDWGDRKRDAFRRVRGVLFLKEASYSQIGRNKTIVVHYFPQVLQQILVARLALLPADGSDAISTAVRTVIGLQLPFRLQYSKLLLLHLPQNDQF